MGICSDKTVVKGGAGGVGGDGGVEEKEEGIGTTEVLKKGDKLFLRKANECCQPAVGAVIIKGAWNFPGTPGEWHNGGQH